MRCWRRYEPNTAQKRSAVRSLLLDARRLQGLYERKGQKENTYPARYRVGVVHVVANCSSLWLGGPLLGEWLATVVFFSV